MSSTIKVFRRAPSFVPELIGELVIDELVQEVRVIRGEVPIHVYREIKMNLGPILSSSGPWPLVGETNGTWYTAVYERGKGQ